MRLPPCFPFPEDQAMIWADRIALAALALAAFFFAGLYANSPSWKEVWFEQARWSMHCYDARRDPAPCSVPVPKTADVRTLGSTALEFLNFAFWVVLPAWLALRIVAFALRRRERKRATLIP